jgi:hypothetical protein
VLEKCRIARRTVDLQETEAEDDSQAPLSAALELDGGEIYDGCNDVHDVSENIRGSLERYVRSHCKAELPC